MCNIPGMTTTKTPPGKTWVDLESLILRKLRDSPGGKARTDVLRALARYEGWNDKYVTQAVGKSWMDLYRVAGESRYEPWTVHHPFGAAASGGPNFELDCWLVRYFRDHETGKVASIALQEAVEAAGFDPENLKQAYRRLQITSVKNGRSWYRRMDPGTVRAHLEMMEGAGA